MRGFKDLERRGQCSSCGAFKYVSGGLGPCLARGHEYYDEDIRGWYEMVAWCDGCSNWAETLEECLENWKRDDRWQ
jgi:hypothetical protein